MAELLALVKALAQEFPSLSPSRARESVSELLEKAEERGSDLSPDECKGLITFVVTLAAPRVLAVQHLQFPCLELISRAGLAVRKFDDETTRAELHNFFFKLMKKEAKVQPCFKAKVMITMLQFLLRWTQAANVATALTADGLFKADVITGLVEALAGEMGRSNRWKPRWQQKAVDALRKILKHVPKAMDQAVAILKKSDDPPTLLVAAVTAEAASIAEMPLRTTLIELYSKHVLEAKQPIASDFGLEAWAPVLASVTAEEFEKQLLPTALRMMKRNPAAITVSFPSMVANLKLDISKQAKEILDPIAPDCLKDKDRRESGRRLVRQVVHRSEDFATGPLAVAEAWSEQLKKSGKADEKQAALRAIAELIGNLPKDASVGDLSKLVDSKGAIAKAAAEDANEETRFLALRVLGLVALRLASASQDLAVEELLKSLVDKKAPDRARLAALTALAAVAEDVAAQGSAPKWTTSLFDKAIPFMTLAVTKPVHRLQSLLAWAASASFAQVDREGLASRLKKEQLTLLKDGMSFLNAVPIVLKSPYSELAAQAQLWKAVLAGYIPGLPSLPEAAEVVVASALSLPPRGFGEVLPHCRSTIVLLAALHSASPERGDGNVSGRKPIPTPAESLGLTAAVKTLSNADAESFITLISQGFLAWLAELNALPKGQRQVTSASLRETLVDICATVSAAKVPLRPEALGWLALAAHHPLLGSSRWPAAKLWRWLSTKGPLVSALRSIGRGVWRPLRMLLTAAQTLPEIDSTGCRRAAIALAGALAPEVALDESKSSLRDELALLLQDCISALHSDDAAHEKEENVKIYFAPDGRLWVEEGIYVAEEREDKNVKKNKFLKGLYEDDDIVAEKAPAPSKPSASAKSAGDKKTAGKGAKGKGSGGAPASSGAMTASQIEASRIQEQSETRQRIRVWVDEASFAMDVLAALAGSPGNRPCLEEAMSDMMPHFMKLLRSPLTVLRARRCLRFIVSRVVSRSSVMRRDLLPDALTVIAKGWLQRSPAAAGTAGEIPVCQVVLDGVDVHHPLPAPTLALVLPVILRTLFDSSPHIQEVCTSALRLLERQLLLGVEVPEESVAEVFDSLSIVLLALPGQRHATQAAMLAASQHLVSTDEQLARLADMFFSDEDLVRQAVIAALAELPKNESLKAGHLDANAARAVLRLGALDEKSSEMAKKTIEDLEFDVDEVLLLELIDFGSKKAGLDKTMQELIANTIAEVLTDLDQEDVTQTALDILTQLFREDAASRVTVARCLEKIYATNLSGKDQVVKAFRFLLRQGLTLTSGSSPEAIELRDVLLAAGIALIEKHGESFAERLIATVEEFEDGAAGAAASESARLGVAVFLGALSKHLSADNPKIPEILPRLLQRLLDPTSTISVQNAIVKVMPPLMKQNKEQATETLEQLLETALEPKTEAVTRRGAALGLGATVKGLSIQAVSQHGILKKIEAAAEDKKFAQVRMGALLCLEGLTLSLGRLFDPYVVSSLPLLLQAFSDSQQTVRNASQSAAGVMMSQLSGPGVKQVLKPLLEGIKDKQWRTKLGSIELLAAMTSCLPKQLAACLPQVVPALCGVINDQHAKVKEAAREAIDKIGSIITSPELRAIAPELISALTDGAQYEHITMQVLDKLLATSFVHHIDAPSLSLVCPLVQRALKERSGEMKRKGAQIVGSMVLLIKDAKDIQPYLPLLLPQLKVTLVDPIPDVRATAAKAFGTLANGLPEEMLGDVLPWLFNMLRSSESAVERSGAAHGLSEVLMAMGTERIEMLLPDILANASNKDAPAEVKEGYLGLFVYLPVAMGSSFEPYIEEVLTALLRGMADDVSSVRDTAFKAAQVLTKQFSANYTALLLPPLEEGVFDIDWRIRHGSVQLMGQLIEQILRAHRIPTNSAELMQCEVLPKEWRCHMLASLYIVRSDENGVVKQACQQVWKLVVQNTPRTLKELLPALMTRLIANLASTNREKQRVAARCVGDLVGKLGERVMPELMPIFMNTLSTGDAHVREGVCIGLAELINATTKQLLADYLNDLIPAIRQAIIDDEETVRNSASTVVALLHNGVGPKATNDIVSWILEQLQDDEVEDHGHLFLHGLEQLMMKQPGAVLPLVLSRLTSLTSWTALQIQGLASLAVVPDAHTVHRHLSDVLPIFFNVCGDEANENELREEAIQSACKVVDAVEQSGLNLLFNELTGPMQDKANSASRVSAARIFEHFYESTSLDVVGTLSLALPVILPSALADEDDEALRCSMNALNSIVKKCKKEELAPYLADVRHAVLQLITDPETKKVDPSILLPGLCNHKGLEPLYPIYQHGLMFGSADARELAAKGLGELVDHTTEEALKPYVVKITGPLIRIVGDRFPGTVKKAIVDTLKSLLIRGGDTLKPFLPQLQTTYVKCLADPSEAVRQRAAESLGTLVRRSARTEPLINELATGVATNADPAARLAMCIALGEVLLNVPQAAGEAVQEKILDAIQSKALGGEGSQRERETAGWALGMLIRRHLSPEKAEAMLKEEVAPALTGPASVGAALALAGACWCQAPQLPDPPTSDVKSLASDALPKLLSSSDNEVQSAALCLAASVAKLHAFASLSWQLPAVSAERIATLVAPGSNLPARAVLLAARHYLGACQQAGESSVAAGAKVAAAVAERGIHKSCEDPEDAERALAAALAAETGDISQVKASFEKLVGGLDAKASPVLRDFGSKRLKALSQHCGRFDFAWDL